MILTLYLHLFQKSLTLLAMKRAINFTTTLPRTEEGQRAVIVIRFGGIAESGRKRTLSLSLAVLRA